MARGGARPNTGGARPGAGRPKGSPNKASAKRQAQIARSGLTPLEFLIKRMRNTKADMAERIACAKAAAPYVHPKLEAIEHTGDIAVRHEDAIKELA